ncbi:MAG TPA: hypothetical protein VFT38_19970, partial [Vicinamibacteria bacterium]|nr:hypothetical protein [Vicinamibacteria bacterium]
LFALLSSPPHKDEAPSPAAAAADLSGQWDVKVEYAAGVSNHALNLRQRGNEIDGAHRGDFVSRDLTGTIDGNGVRIRSFLGEQSGDSIGYTFTGKVTGDEMGGTLDMGEYLGAKWSARRRAARRG